MEATSPAGSVHASEAGFSEAGSVYENAGGLDEFVVDAAQTARWRQRALAAEALCERATAAIEHANRLCGHATAAMEQSRGAIATELTLQAFAEARRELRDEARGRARAARAEDDDTDELDYASAETTAVTPENVVCIANSPGPAGR